MRHYLGIFLAVTLLVIPWFSFTYPQEMSVAISAISSFGEQLAAVITSHNPKTVADIQSRYSEASKKDSDKKVRIMIVPGHEPNYGGAEFGLIKERELNVELGQYLEQFLASNSHYEVYISRSKDAWSANLAAYFKNNWTDIIAWVKANRAEVSHLISIGTVKKPVATVIHNKAPTDVAYRLFGITKWSNENDIDIVIHIHFNDHTGHSKNTPGDHSGFAIYIPEKQYGNSTTTLAVANTIFKRLEKYNPVSDLPGESTGIVEEPDLIAIGAANTSNAASMLIEYGYIYEAQLVNPALRSSALKDLAFQTYLGLQDFFDVNSVAGTFSYGTLLIPHQWNNIVTKNDGASSPDIYALQTALVMDGTYPPGDKSLNDCPRSGAIGPCTVSALAEFQKRYGITDEKGIIGSKTRSVLNGKFGLDAII
ncbi:MAG: N-acetylmuramoyl-L-alanine amidase [Candidatus Taylorbacteria bacterium]